MLRLATAVAPILLSVPAFAATAPDTATAAPAPVAPPPAAAPALSAEECAVFRSEAAFARSVEHARQQAHAGMHSVLVRQQGLITGETDDLRQAGQGFRHAARWAGQDLHGMGAEQVIQPGVDHW